MSLRKDYYKILGVARDADVRTIKKSYKRAAVQYHPDKAPAAERAAFEEKFKEVGKGAVGGPGVGGMGLGAGRWGRQRPRRRPRLAAGGGRPDPDPTPLTPPPPGTPAPPPQPPRSRRRTRC
jgi:hypothetical protein